MAASTRTSTWIVRVPPSRSISRSCRARSSLAWRSSAQLADLVEEERAAVGQLELPELARVRAGEGALLVAEQLGLDQGVGDRGAVDRHEGLGRGAGSAGGWRAPPAPCRCRSRR